MTRRHIIAIDIGGTKCIAALYDDDHRTPIRQLTIQTRASEGFSAVLQDVLRLIEELHTDEAAAIGIGVPGFVKQPDGIILRLPNIPGAEGTHLQALLEQKTGLRVSVGNDSQTFALAEALEGAGKGHDVVVGITMGTGVGGGIVIDGKLFEGSSGCAGELGHTLLLPGQPPYATDDRRGETEQFLSGTAMKKRCEAAKKPEDLLAGEACAFLHPSIIKEAAWLCTNLTYVLNPSIIVFGGSTGRALESYLPAIHTEMLQWTLRDTPLPQFAIRKLKDAATRGAALLVMNEIDNE